jgi:hypothetical protein
MGLLSPRHSYISTVDNIRSLRSEQSTDTASSAVCGAPSAQHNSPWVVQTAYLEKVDGQLGLEALGHFDEGVVWLLLEHLDPDDVAIVGEEVEELFGVYLLQSMRTRRS